MNFNYFLSQAKSGPFNQILGLLDVDDLINVSKTSKELRSLANQDVFWKSYLQGRNIPVNKDVSPKQQVISLFKKYCSVLENIVPESVTEKDIFKRKVVIDKFIKENPDQDIYDTSEKAFCIGPRNINNHREIIPLLSEIGVKPQYLNPYLSTKLPPEIIISWVHAGVATNAATPVLAARNRQPLDLVKLLVEDTQTKFTEDKIISCALRRSSSKESIELLLKAGAKPQTDSVPEALQNDCSQELIDLLQAALDIKNT